MAMIIVVLKLNSMGYKKAEEQKMQKNKGHREIEFKATRVASEQFKEALERLQQMTKNGEAVFKGTLKQDDRYLDHLAFMDTEYALYGEGDGSKSLRIRKEEGDEGNHTLCLKITRKGKDHDDHERYEYEAHIANPDETLEIFRLLGFGVEKIIRKIKKFFFISKL